MAIEIRESPRRHAAYEGGRPPGPFAPAFQREEVANPLDRREGIGSHRFESDREHALRINLLECQGPRLDLARPVASIELDPRTCLEQRVDRLGPFRDEFGESLVREVDILDEAVHQGDRDAKGGVFPHR